MSTKNVLDDDNGSDVDDVMFIRESSEIGVEFGRLLLGDCESERPGDGGQESERCTDDTSSDLGSDRRSASARDIALRLREIGDQIGPIQEQAFTDIITSRDLSVYDVTQQVFHELSDSVLGNRATQLTSGWKQISAIYHILSLLVRELRTQTPRNPVQRDREALFCTFTAEYIREVGLEAWVRQQGGYSAILDPTSPHLVTPPSAVTSLPTSSNSDNTREYIPACFSPVATLSQCTHNGRHYRDECNEFGLEIPAGAIPEEESITIDIGVALYGPFQYPEGLRPVSPVFWVCVRDRKDFQFLKPVEITIPHCLNLENRNDIESLGLSILKGDHEMNLQQIYQFQKHEGGSVLEPLKKYGILKTTHFCSQCITSDIKKEYIQKAVFSISAVFPSVISTTDSAYFFITFLLKTCLHVVDKQISKDPAIKGHNRETRHFQFKKDKTLEIVLPQSLPDDWKMGLQFTDKVSVSDIRFDNKTVDDLQLMEERGMYPPRFTVPIICRSPTAVPQLARIRFKGAVKDLAFDIPLVPIPTSPKSPASTTSLPSADNPGTNPPGRRNQEGMRKTLDMSSSPDGSLSFSFPLDFFGLCLQTKKMEDEPELVELMNEVAARIPSKWREVGIQLHLSSDHLDGIAVSVSSPHDRFISVFTLWKKQMTLPYKWSTVIQSLKAPAVNEIRLAEELTNKVTV